MSWPWSQLGLPGPSGLPEIRHAYAEKLKTTHPEEDPEGFQRLHSAYQLASRMARQQKRQAGPPPTPQTERPSRPRPEQPPRGGGGFDYSEPSVRNEPPRRPSEEEKDFDYDELLKKDEAPPRPPGHEGAEEDFDFASLLSEDESPRLPSREEEEQDWDYERLFAEGEAERAEARRLRGGERSGKREFQERHRFQQDEDRWKSTETILHSIEMMYNSRAEGEVWNKFFMSPLFQQAKGTLDLIFGLEDFVSTRNLSQEVRLALFLAYGFDKGVSRPEWRPLYQMLLPAWRAKKREKNQKRYHFWLGVGAAAAVFLLLNETGNREAMVGMAAAAGVIGLVVIWGVFRSLSRQVGKGKAALRVGLGLVLLGLTLLLVTRGPEMLERAELYVPSKDAREQVCKYMERDFGARFKPMFAKNGARTDNVFLCEGAADKQFLAGPDGRRSKKDGKLGYTTNYPEMMVLWALKDFAQARKIYGVDDPDKDQGLERWETSGTFLICLPDSGAEAVITDLKELLNGLAQEEWYQVRPPEYELVLCSQKMEEGRMILGRYPSSEGIFDAEAVCDEYRTSFRHDYCAQLLRELELDWDFIRQEGGRYTLTNEGMASIKGAECCKLFGVDSSGAVAQEYYVDLEERSIYCVPGGFWAAGNSEEQFSFYRLLYWGDTLGRFNLYYPWLKVD